MDTGEIGIIIAIIIGVGAIIWQSWAQGNKLDRRMDSIEEKVSDAALAAARNEGRYDVLTAHSHTHEPPSSTAAAD